MCDFSLISSPFERRHSHLNILHNTHFFANYFFFDMLKVVCVHVCTCARMLTESFHSEVEYVERK